MRPALRSCALVNGSIGGSSSDSADEKRTHAVATIDLVADTTPEDFKRIIDEELKKAQAAVKKGMPVSKLYEELVVKKGKKTL